MLLAEHELEKHEDALTRGRVGRQAEGDARHQRPSWEGGAVGAPPVKDLVGEALHVRRVEDAGALRGREVKRQDCNSSTATTPKGDYKDKRKLTFHKEDGKKTKFGTITDTWAASWEPKDHTKRGPPDATA